MRIAATSLRGFLIAFSLLGALSVAKAQTPQPSSQQTPTLSTEQIEQLVAPIALHPDALLSQILMASTYPLEVVEASRWVKANPGIEGAALEGAIQNQPWDPSVKSLTAFPQVLQMMNEELSWTQQLGDAFLAQQGDVLDAVQRLRAKADAQGNLETTKEQKVEKQTVTSDSSQTETVIVIEQADPKVVYVPAYDPIVIYGTWPYPAYPPYYWYPPGYVARRAIWFAVGIAVGHALWGRCDWRRRSVNINVNVYNSFNRTKITSNRWQHKVEHRRGVPYRDKAVSNRYRPATRDVRSREQFRGRAEAARRDLPKIDRPATVPRPGPGAGQRPGAGQLPSSGQRPGTGKRPAIGQLPSTGKRPGAVKPGGPAQLPSGSQRPAVPKQPKVAARPAPAKRPAAVKRPAPAKQPAALQNLGKGKQVRKQSARGKQSRKVARSAPQRRPAASRGGGGRGGGRKRR